MHSVRLYDPDGDTVARVIYKKDDIRYDAKRNALIIPADKIRLDYSAGNEKLAKSYQSVKPLYLEFWKQPKESIHYAL